MRALRPVFLLALALGLSGCFQLHTLLKVFPDGSGQLVTSVQMTAETYERFKAFAELSPSSKEAFSLIDEEELRAAAKTYGPGVAFEGVKPLDENGARGYVATYRVADVTTLALSLTPSLPMGDAKPDDEPVVTFGMRPASAGAPAVLTMQTASLLSEMGLSDLGFPGSPAGKSADEEWTMVRDALQGMEVSLRVEPQGAIEETTASFEEAGTITLMRLDLDAMLADPALLERLQQREPPASAEETAEQLAEIPGLDAEAQPTVTVMFE